MVTGVTLERNRTTLGKDPHIRNPSNNQFHSYLIVTVLFLDMRSWTNPKHFWNPHTVGSGVGMMPHWPRGTLCLCRFLHTHKLTNPNVNCSLQLPFCSAHICIHICIRGFYRVQNPPETDCRPPFAACPWKPCVFVQYATQYGFSPSEYEFCIPPAVAMKEFPSPHISPRV